MLQNVKFDKYLYMLQIKWRCWFEEKVEICNFVHKLSKINNNL
jgi:hypothetical protein